MWILVIACMIPSYMEYLYKEKTVIVYKQELCGGNEIPDPPSKSNNKDERK